ncbi:AAEL010287-PA [Aedes aegypti]|uniref:AAEL010287-PA n=2 Tax=Aedes aegypti TaxID=7159 RepID=A0A1S4FPT7_AEDAE|nr:zinc finger protein 93 [Aedes aegypti]EAT37747.1 AAEL010287-PA [Aedes aegypti]
MSTTPEPVKVKAEPHDYDASSSPLDEKHRLKRLRSLRKLLQNANVFESLKLRYLESLELRNEAPDKEAPTVTSDVAGWICEVCGQTFGSTKNMLRHMEGYHTIPGSVIERAGKSLFRCKFCELEFPARNQLLRHCQRKHAELVRARKKFLKHNEGLSQEKICVYCNVKAGNLEEFVTHLEKNHAGNFCDICYKVFQDSTFVILHRRVHLGENPFACDLCPKVFRSLQHVGEHRRCHTGHKPYKCVECPMGFARIGDLNKHKKLRHTAVPSYLCSQCPESFHSSSLFHRHKQKHQKAVEMGIDDTRPAVFACGQCNELFENGNDRKEHVLVRHAEGRPFECGDCGKRFKLGSHLKAHALTHSGVKSQKCDQCPAAFYLMGDLRRHQKTHRKMEES